MQINHVNLKKHTMPKLLFCTLCLLLLSQCTVQKRIHRKGWHVTWHTPSTHAANQVVSATQPTDATENDTLQLANSSDVQVAPNATVEVDTLSTLVTKSENISSGRSLRDVTNFKLATSAARMKAYVQAETKPTPTHQLASTWHSRTKWKMVLFLAIALVINIYVIGKIASQSSEENESFNQDFLGLAATIFLFLTAGLISVLLVIALLVPSREERDQRRAKRQQQRAQQQATPETKSESRAATRGILIAAGIALSLIALFMVIAK